MNDLNKFNTELCECECAPADEPEKGQVHNCIRFNAVALPCSSHAAYNNANAYLTSAEAAEAPAPEEPKAPTPPPPPPKGNLHL